MQANRPERKDALVSHAIRNTSPVRIKTGALTALTPIADGRCDDNSDNSDWTNSTIIFFRILTGYTVQYKYPQITISIIIVIIIMSRSLLCLLVTLLSSGTCFAWSPNPLSSVFGSTRVQHSIIHSDSSSSTDDESSSSAFASRRNFLSAAAMNICLLGAAAPAMAAPSPTPDEEQTKATIYRSGKQPMVPGQKPRDKGDTKGSRKDPDFLRSISDCKSQCQTTPGSDGLARPKEDCLSDCQDICCKTYEQCTFDIVPRI